jgi:small-conductance mechanosensitive channel
MAGDLVLMSVTDQDGQLAGETRQKLAQDLKDRIRTAVVELRKEYSGKTLLMGGIYTLAATLLLVLLFVLLGRLFPMLYRKLDAGRGTVVPSLRIQDFEVLTSDRIVDSALGLARLLRVSISLVALYFYAWLVLGFFAWTRTYAELLLGYVMAPLRLVGATMVGYVPNVMFIVVIGLVAYYAIKLVRVLFAEIGKETITIPGFHPEWAEPTYKIVRFLILVLAVIVISPYLPGAKSPAFKGISIFIGVLFSLGSSSAVANVVAGTILTYMRAFRLGDRVQIADTVGDVIEVSFLVTRIRTIKNVEITIANSMVLGSHIVNFSASARERGGGALILHTEVTIGFDAPWRQVHELLIDAALATESVLQTPAPFVLQTALDDFYVHYEINAYTSQPQRMAVTYSELHKNIQDKFNEAGVEIMSPHYGSVRDGNAIAIPEKYRPAGYEAPRFRIGMKAVKDAGNIDGR